MVNESITKDENIRYKYIIENLNSLGAYIEFFSSGLLKSIYERKQKYVFKTNEQLK